MFWLIVTAFAFFIQNGFQEIPAFVFLNSAFDFPMTNLLIESVQSWPVVAPEKQVLLFFWPPKLRRSKRPSAVRVQVTPMIEHFDQFRSQFNHTANGFLVSQEVAAIDGIVKMLVDGVVLTFGVHAGVNAALRTNRMRTLNRAKGEEIDFATGFADLHSGHQARKAAANNNNFFTRFPLFPKI